jgi:hypothetical protein
MLPISERSGAFILGALLLVAGVHPSPLPAETDDRDLIVTKTGNRFAVYVDSETTAAVTFHILAGNAQIPAKTLPIRQVDRIVYAGMDSGAWQKGVEAEAAGNEEEAADYYAQVASGSREWQIVYGHYAQGEALERAHRYADAAAAFAVIVKGFAGKPLATPSLPPQRRWLDAVYHEGMDQALAGDAAVSATLAVLDDLAKSDTISGADARADAIRSAVAAKQGRQNDFGDYYSKTILSAQDEPDVWYHYKLFAADTYRTVFQRGSEAEAIYRELQAGVGHDPAKQAEVALGYGLCLAGDDPSAAIMQLLTLDALPAGTEDQKCEARLAAAQLLWHEAQTLRADADAMRDERQSAFALSTERTARLLVAAAAMGPARDPASGTARGLVDTYGKDPVSGDAGAGAAPH